MGTADDTEIEHLLQRVQVQGLGFKGLGLRACHHAALLRHHTHYANTARILPIWCNSKAQAGHVDGHLRKKNQHGKAKYTCSFESDVRALDHLQQDTFFTLMQI